MRDSPIDALRHNICHAFENPNGSKLAEMSKAVSLKLIDPEIELLFEEAPPKPPRVVRTGGEPAQIRLQVPYLEMLWGFAYGWFILFEGVQQAMLEGRFQGVIEYDTPLKQRARDMLRWSAGLKITYSRWPQGAPCPSMTEPVAEASYAAKVNNIFVNAVAFLLHHELGHVLHGHLDAADKTDSEAAKADHKTIEREADDLAFRALISSADDEQTRRIKGWAVLLPALSSVALLHSPKGLFQARHPDMHHRIREMLSRLAFESEHNCFYFEYLCLAVLQNILPPRPQTEVHDTAREALEACLDELDTLRLNDN